jgi:polyisoprenoid-binding protein YceI
MFSTKLKQKLFVWAALASACQAADSTRFAVENGNAAFVANTNVSAIAVKGKSTALTASLRVKRNAQGLDVEQIEAFLPVKSLLTGMSLRDEHMRRYIFTTGAGETPDLRFEAQIVTCSGPTCQIAGNLTVRGIARRFTVPLKFRDEGNSLKASGEAVVKLSDYGIERPSQFGVKTTDEVLLRFEFTARETTDVGASTGGTR